MKLIRPIAVLQVATIGGWVRVSSLAEWWRSWVKTRSPLLPLPAARSGRWQRVGLSLTALLMVVYSVIFIAYLFAMQSTLLTHAEDMGIMDQVLWNTANGHFWHQTICNSVSDNNCLGDVSRWAIHFEPAMLLLVPLYWIVPSPNTLQAVQVLGVAVGALPAYWLGSRRLGHPMAGVLLAFVYLTMPVLASAVSYDFHMVTLSAPALMFAIYFLYTRNNLGFWIAAIAAMGTKEQVPVDVAMLGLAAIALQGRWRFGIQVIVVAAAWAVVALIIIHLASPVGASPTADRYGGISATLARVPELVTDPSRRFYIGDLLANTGYIGLLAPWVLVLAAPSILLNALSPDHNQYSGMFQYNADIVPFLIMALLEGIVTAWWLIRRAQPYVRDLMQTDRWKRGQAWVEATGVAAWTWVAAHTVWLGQRFRQRMTRFGVWLRTHGHILVRPALIYLAFQGAVLFMLQQPQNRLSVAWPATTAHTELAQHFFDLIPANAPVSAQEGLVPHLSHRRDIYQYPDGQATAQYVLLDMTWNEYPEPDENNYAQAVLATLHSGQFALVEARDGYILLVRMPRGAAAPNITLPQSFCPTEPTSNPGAWISINQVSDCDVNPE